MKRYLVLFALTTGIMLGLTAFSAWFVDPYAYWNTPVVEGVNRYRPESGRHLEAVKLRQYARAQPRTLIAGNSRVDVGMDPESAAWPQPMRPVYNLAVPGQGAASTARLVERALFTHQPSAIFVGLDFLDFRMDSASSGTPHAPLPPPTAPDWQQQLALRAKLLLSLDALKDTLGTLAEQHKTYPGDITPLGFNALAEYNAFVAGEGHASLFAQRNRENMASYLGGPKAVRAADGSNPQFHALAELAETARRGRIVLVFFTYPYHADILLGFRRAGLWPAYEDWLRDLAAFSERSGAITYMFTRIDPVTMEAVPQRGDTKTRMKWYWEAGHFKASLGDRMAMIMTSSLDDEFVLTPENVDRHLANLRAGLDAAKNDPEVSARVAAAAAQASVP